MIPLTSPDANPNFPPDDPPVDSLRLAVGRLARRLKKHSGSDLTPAQMSALTSLRRQGCVRMGRLAELEDISRPTATRLIGMLQDMGLAQRVHDTADARSCMVELTPDGDRFLASASLRADEYLARQISALQPDDQRRILEALPALQRLLANKA
ncbi:MarR family winged helix-turn-helix transcriptional regulator [Arthrobacter sp. NPDC056493]|uniref:MarR family winged helix-turn-helix transcriptional regulator n=1 Tax=Arthrobacter sp. NPDC056493 TaxID=3345839 RepID=UPI00366F8486